jgi:hypothetical protein
MRGWLRGVGGLLLTDYLRAGDYICSPLPDGTGKLRLVKNDLQPVFTGRFAYSRLHYLECKPVRYMKGIVPVTKSIAVHRF